MERQKWVTALELAKAKAIQVNKTIIVELLNKLYYLSKLINVNNLIF